MILDIVKRIRDNFDNTYRIYTENVLQGLKTPCFSIIETSSNGGREVGNRYKLNHHVIIQYFPNSANKYAECSEILKKIILLLNDFGNFHGKNITGTITDEVLTVSLNYTEFVHEIESVEDMYTHELKVGVKNGKESTY